MITFFSQDVHTRDMQTLRQLSVYYHLLQQRAPLTHLEHEVVETLFVDRGERSLQFECKLDQQCQVFPARGPGSAGVHLLCGGLEATGSHVRRADRLYFDDVLEFRPLQQLQARILLRSLLCTRKVYYVSVVAVRGDISFCIVGMPKHTYRIIIRDHLVEKPETLEALVVHCLLRVEICNKRKW